MYQVITIHTFQWHYFISNLYSIHHTIPYQDISELCQGLQGFALELHLKENELFWFIAVQSSQDKMTNSCTCPQYIPHIWRSCGTFTSAFAVLLGTMTETSTSSVSFASLGAWNKWKGTRIISTPTSHSLAYLDGLKFQVCILQFRCSKIFFGHHQFHQWTPWKSCIEICPVLLAPGLSHITRRKVTSPNGNARRRKVTSQGGKSHHFVTIPMAQRHPTENQKVTKSSRDIAHSEIFVDFRKFAPNTNGTACAI